MSSRPFHFDACLEPLPWGRNVYVVLRVPDDLAAAARDEATRRVEGDLDGIFVNLGLNRADVIPDPFVYVGGALRRAMSARAGDVVHCRLQPVDPDRVPVPEDVAESLRREGLHQAFELEPASERRRLLAPVADAARPATRDRRVRALVLALRGHGDR